MTEKQKLLRNLKSISIEDRAILEKLFNLSGDGGSDGGQEQHFGNNEPVIIGHGKYDWYDPEDMHYEQYDTDIVEEWIKFKLDENNKEQIYWLNPSVEQSDLIVRAWYTGEGYLYERDENATVPIPHYGLLGETTSYLTIMGLVSTYGNVSIALVHTNDMNGLSVRMKIRYEYAKDVPVS